MLITRIATPAAILAGLLGLCLQAAPAQAQLSRTYVSAAIGNDANDCNRATPCRTFQAAHDKTNSDGEVTVLDPGGYGGLTITKSISIVNDGVGEASILVSGGATGITITAGAAAYVNLRGITIQGIGFGGGNGLAFNSGFSLTMENCVVRNLSGDGIALATKGNSNFALSNTLVADNGGTGISVFAFLSGTIKAVFNRVGVYNSQQGIIVFTVNNAGPVNVTVADSVAAGNGLGFRVQSGGTPTSLTVVRSVASGNATGLIASGPLGVLRISRSTVTGNTTTWQSVSGGVLRSYADNDIDGNGDGGPALPTIATK